MSVNRGNLIRVFTVIRVFLHVILAVAVGILLLYNVYILLARSVFGNGMPTVFGFASASVVSGSMEDTLQVGDFIVTCAQEQYAVGDIILFYDRGSGTYITHRILLASPDGYTTKGDANDVPDANRVQHSDVVGKVVTVWKGFGNTISFFRTPAGLLCAVGGVAVLWVALDIGTEVFRKRNHGREEI